LRKVESNVFEKSFLGPPPLTTTVSVMLVVWLILLVLGALPALMGTGMAFEGGHTLDAYLALFSIWSYPPLVGLAYFFRRRKPALIWLPLLTILLFIVDQIVWDLGVRVRFD
jgi:hypothetical protein